MSASNVKSVGYALEGVLFHADGGQVEKQHFNVYGENSVYLGHGKTASDGKFYIEVKTPSPLDEKITLTFRLCREVKLVHEHEVLGKDAALCQNLGFYRGQMETAEAVETFVLDRLKKDLGEVHLEKPYEEEKVPLRYTLDIAKASIPSRIKAFISSAREKLDFFNTHGIDDVMNAFNVKSVPLTPENTWKMITNGICPLYLREEGDHYIAEVNWDRYEFDKLKSLADVKVWFKKNGDLDPILDRIDVKFRKTLEPSVKEGDYTPVKTYLPDQDSFEEGLRIANCSFHVLGQTVFHLGIGHVYGANAAIAAFDYLVGHPLGDLLLPHCHFIRKISKELGGPVIFEEDGVLNVSALSVKGIATLISDSLAALDPFSFKPRGPINDGHVFAKVQNHHFSLLKDAVKEYFDEHWGEIVKDWKPVHGFFRKMFKRSPEYRPWGGVSLEDGNWRDANEIGGKASELLPTRQSYRNGDEGVHSFRYIAPLLDGPLPGERELIEQFVVDFIHHVTIWHSWIHRSQYISTEASPDAADVNFAPLSLSEYGVGEYGGMSMQDAIHQLKIISLFHHFDVKNYALVDGDGVYPGIVRRIQAAASGYLANGIDPFKELQVSTVI